MMTMERRLTNNRRDTDKRDFDMRGRMNLNVGAMLIGVISLVWAPVPYWSDPETTAVARWIIESNLAAAWTLYLLGAGSATLYGALMPHRRIRFWALSLLAFFYLAFSLLGVERFTYNPTSMIALVLGVFAVGILIRDTNRKPRKCQNLNSG